MDLNSPRSVTTSGSSFCCFNGLCLIQVVKALVDKVKLLLQSLPPPKKKPAKQPITPKPSPPSAQLPAAKPVGSPSPPKTPSDLTLPTRPSAPAPVVPKPEPKPVGEDIPVVDVLSDNPEVQTPVHRILGLTFPRS